jgi:hypothetical protein
MRNASPSRSQRLPNLAPQIRTAFSSMAWNTGSSSPGVELMILRTTVVAASRSRASASSRVSCSTFVSLPVARDPRRLVTFAVLRRFEVLRRFVFTALPPALLLGLIPTRCSGPTKLAHWRAGYSAILTMVMSALGQKRTLRLSNCDVRFTPESGHRDVSVECPLRAKRGH